MQTDTVILLETGHSLLETQMRYHRCCIPTRCERRQHLTILDAGCPRNNSREVERGDEQECSVNATDVDTYFIMYGEATT